MYKRISYFFKRISNLKLMNLMLMSLMSMNLKLINLMLINFKLINLKLAVFLYFLVPFGACYCFLSFFVLVKSYRKKKYKKLKAGLITSFILLL